jgi:mRNA interferase RelE/StbE
MPTYRIEFGSLASRSFAKLDAPTRRRIAARVDQLADDPRPAGAKRLVAPEELYRIRVGAHRIVYTIEENVLIVLVVKIGHRRDVYRGL